MTTKTKKSTTEIVASQAKGRAMDNSPYLKLWHQVAETDPRYTKQVSYGNHSYTAIDAYWQMKMATSVFGQYGAAWGLRNIKISYELMPIGLIVMSCEFFFPDGSFEINNSISAMKSKKDSTGDPDVFKKLETDTITKALSRLGFSADVFMGQFDDVDYVKDLEAQYSRSNEQQSLCDQLMAADIDTARKIWATIPTQERSKYRDVVKRLKQSHHADNQKGEYNGSTQ